MRIGDIVCLKNEDKIAADMVLLTYNSFNSYCFIETSNLDGERNLKPKISIMK